MIRKQGVPRLKKTALKQAAAMPLSEVRQRLSPLVKSLPGKPGGKVAIAVHGRVQAYLISKQQYEAYERRVEPKRKTIDRKALAKLTREMFGDPDTFEERSRAATAAVMDGVVRKFRKAFEE